MTVDVAKMPGSLTKMAQFIRRLLGLSPALELQSESGDEVVICLMWMAYSGELTRYDGREWLAEDRLEIIKLRRARHVKAIEFYRLRRLHH